MVGVNFMFWGQKSMSKVVAPEANVAIRHDMP